MPTPFRQQPARYRGLRVGPLLMYFLPLPLLVVVITAVARGNFIRLASTLAALGLFWLAARFLRQAAHYEQILKRRKWARATRVPWRFSASVFTAAGVALVSLFTLGNGLLVSVIISLMAFAGILLTYGFDPQHDRKRDTSRYGVTVEEIVEVLDEADNNLEQLENAAGNISNRELKTRLNRVVDKTRGILTLIEEDPKDLRRARKFLKVYLDGTRKVSTQYARTHKMQDNEALEASFRNVLDTIDEVIDELHGKLLENDALDLDVKIEVLETQLRHEGVI